MKASKALLVAVAFTFALASCDSNDPPPPREATFEGLGDLPGGNFDSWAGAVSADGSVVVGGGTSASGSEAYRWVADPAAGEGGTMTGLGDLPGGTFDSHALDVSADGSVVVGWGNSDDGSEAFRWASGTMIGMGDLPGAEFSSRAWGVSADGSIIVGFGNGNFSEGHSEAFRWEGGQMENLSSLPGGGSYSDARKVSDDGSVIVGSSGSADGTQAFRLENGAMEGLGDLPGGSFRSIANAVSANGEVVVGLSASSAHSSSSGGEAFRWEGGEMEGLGGLPPGDFESSSARDVSGDGAVVVGSSSSEEMGAEAFIWTRDGGMRHLQSVLEGDYGLDLTGWSLDYAYGISDDGTVIVGSGTNPNGDTEAWRAFLGEPVGSNQ